MTVCQDKEYRRVIGEELTTCFNIIPVGLPAENDEYIMVYPHTFFVCNGTIYYEDNKAETLYLDVEIERALEKAKEYMLHRKDKIQKMTYVTAYNRADRSIAQRLLVEKANNRLIKKLEGFTKYDFYNRSY